MNSLKSKYKKQRSEGYKGNLSGEWKHFFQQTIGVATWMILDVKMMIRNGKK